MTHNGSTSDDDDESLFHTAMCDVAPLPVSDKLPQSRARILPIPYKSRNETLLADNFSDHIAIALETGDSWSFMRPGLSAQTLKRLRRGYWKIDDTLDLHGFTRDEARQELTFFLENCLRNQYRCIRIIHGKGLGSKDREPVLKTKIGNWLIQCADVLAFCQARPIDGGGGALLVLLRSKK
ncbi:Smr/MutS family protein [Nitrosomonas sp. wSCUT-2]